MTHVIEEARSGRAVCRVCGNAITKAEIRFGEEIPNAFDPDGGTTHHWFHLMCAAVRKPHILKEALDQHPGNIPTRSDLERTCQENWLLARPPFPYAERASTGRSRCQACRRSIDKGAFRVATARPPGSVPPDGSAFYHPACAIVHLGMADLGPKLHKHSHALSPADLAELHEILKAT
jgi:hypothetical protein